MKAKQLIFWKNVKMREITKKEGFERKMPATRVRRYISTLGRGNESPFGAFLEGWRDIKVTGGVWFK